MRADTNLGNILLNILLSDQIPTTRSGFNSVGKRQTLNSFSLNSDNFKNKTNQIEYLTLKKLSLNNKKQINLKSWGAVPALTLTNSCCSRRVGKNNVMLICVPNPPVDPKADAATPVSMLFR